MDNLAAGLTVLANGLLTLLSALFSPVELCIVVMVVALSWLARLAVDDLDRQGSKPVVPRH